MARSAFGSRYTPSGDILDAIRAGDRVRIVDRFGKEREGRAVMRGPYGWVLNMGGRHGTPAVATAENITHVRRPKGNPPGDPSWWAAPIFSHALVASGSGAPRRALQLYKQHGRSALIRADGRLTVYTTDARGRRVQRTKELTRTSAAEAVRALGANPPIQHEGSEPPAGAPPPAAVRHALTMVPSGEHVHAHCLCGWVAGARTTRPRARALFERHKKAAARKKPKRKNPRGVPELGGEQWRRGFKTRAEAQSFADEKAAALKRAGFTAHRPRVSGRAGNYSVMFVDVVTPNPGAWSGHASARGGELVSRRVLRVEYEHVNDPAHVAREHDFGPGVFMYALRDGTVLLRHREHPRRKLWADFPDKGRR